jgi:hypothetical protein
VRTLLRSVLLVAGIVSMTSASRAELVYQPPPPLSGSALDQSWREAGAALFNAIAAFNETLADLELRRGVSAAAKLSQAQRLLRDASDRYDKLSKAIPSPRVVVFAKLSDEEKARMTDVERTYDVKRPANEREAADLAVAETLRLLKHFEELRPGILRSDVGAVRSALVEVHRLQRIGTQTALTLKTVQAAERK